jgi:hypothetical protein
MTKALARELRSDHTLTKRLIAAGYGHMPNDRTEVTGKHTIYRIDSGSVVGDMTADEVVEFLRSLLME